MKVQKAIITAAGRGIRQYPASDTVQKAMLPLVDRDGLTKPVLQIIAEEAFESGIEQICVVTAPDDEQYYRRHFRSFAEALKTAFRNMAWASEQARRLSELEQRISFVVQPEPEGYGHAVWCARHFAGQDPILLLLGDHIYISSSEKRCARQIIDLAEAESCPVSGVQATREHLIHQYGTLTGKRLQTRPDAYQIEEILEKPTTTLAELRLQTPGLRSGHYLCFFGMHVLTPRTFEMLDQAVHASARDHAGQIPLTPVLNALAKEQKYLALETLGTRHNLGVKFGFVEAQIALALAGVDERAMLATLIESMLRVEQQARDRAGERDHHAVALTR